MSQLSTPYFDAKAWMPATSAGMTVEFDASQVGNATTGMLSPAGMDRAKIR
jgi:hypothetical protein